MHLTDTADDPLEASGNTTDRILGGGVGAVE